LRISRAPPQQSEDRTLYGTLSPRDSRHTSEALVWHKTDHIRSGKKSEL